jgi:hypothetical protein
MNAHSRPLCVGVACLWAAGLAIEAVMRTLLFFVRQTSTGEWEFAVTLPISAIAGSFVLALIAALVALWRLREWGRKLLLVLITLYYGTLLGASIALWGPLTGMPIRAPGQNWVTLVVLEATAGLAFGWWYLNRRQLRACLVASPNPDPDGPGRQR